MPYRISAHRPSASTGVRVSTEVSGRYLRPWCSRVTARHPWLQASWTRGMSAGFWAARTDFTLVWRIRFPEPSRRPTESGTSVPKKNPRFTERPVKPLRL
jgi:hypothetical protein